MATGDTEDITLASRTLIATTATTNSLTTDDDRAYTVTHTGVNSSGGLTSDALFLTLQQGFDAVGAPSADFSAEANKLILLSGQSITLPAGVTTIGYVAESGNICVQVTSSSVQFGEGH